MPDTDEHVNDSRNVSNITLITNNNNNIDPHTSNMSSTAILRYSKDTLLSLHNSPLVCKPKNMPPLSSWFCEEADSPAVYKNMLNGSAVSKSTDKSIVLGPSKTNFASSLYGGLKRTVESNGDATMGVSKSNPRLRQSEDSTRTSNGNHSSNTSNNRTSRGPAHVGEKGLHHHHHHNNNHQHHRSRHEKAGLERRTLDSYGNQSVLQPKRFNKSDHSGERQPTNGSTSGRRRDFNREQRTGNRNTHLNYNDMHSNGQDQVPEWMDYNPTDTKQTTGTDNPLDSHGDFVNDLEAWKSSMKKKNGLDNTLKTSTEETLPPIQPNGHDNNDFLNKIMDLESLDLNSSTTFDNITVSSKASSFNSSNTATDLPPKRGSRFAKFFAKREEESQVSSTTSSPLAHEEHSISHGQPKSISVNDLFQTPGGLSPSEIATGQVLTRNDPHTSEHHDQGTSPNVRVFSEEDLLQSIGAKKSVPYPGESNQDAIGFNKVLQILSQPKPTVPVSPSSNTNVTSPTNTNSVPTKENQQLDDNSEAAPNNKGTSPAYSPHVNQRPVLNTEIASPSDSHAQPSPPITKPKKVNQLFGGNLPTSVLRQMSARSEGRSPSLSSNKSGHSGRFSASTPNSQNGSPMNGHVSPSFRHLQTAQQQYSPIQVHHGIPSRTMDPQSNAKQLHYPDFAHEGNGPMMGTNRSRYDSDRMGPTHMLQSGESMAPPTHHHQGGTMNHMMSAPSSFNQQQQQVLSDRSYMPPHHHHPHPPLPPPSMMGMPGQHPMMSPHLSMRLQGNQATGLPLPPLPPPFMHQHPPPQPLVPGMIPPPQPMGMGIPQHMYTSKTQGWNNQQ